MFRPLTSAPTKTESTCLEHLTERFSFFHSCSISLAPSVRESPPTENDSELSDKTGGRKSGVSRLRVLIG